MANKKNIEKAPYITKSDAKDPLLQLRKVDEGSFKIVVLSSFIIVTGSYAFGTCIGFTAPVQEAILRDLDLSIAQFSFFGSILSVGATIGAITSGHVSDYFGRKRAMRISCLITLIGWSAIYFSKGSTSLDVGRLLTGLGIGVFSYVVPVYISEIAPTSIRGGLIALNQLMIVLGISCTMLLGIVATWRQLALHGILPCVVMLFGLLIIPESPRWLESLEIVEHLPKVGILDLFQRRYIPSLTVTVGLMAFQQCGGVNGIGFYTSEIFLAAGNSSAKLGLALYAFIQFATLGTTLACLLIGICFLLKGYGLLLEWVPSLVVLGVVCFISSFSSGYGAIPWVMMSEVG